MGEPQNQKTLKSSNRARLLERIRRQPTARAELARQLGLTKSAVTLLTGEMIREGLLREAGPAEKSAAPGRTSILLDIVPDHAFAVGIALHRRVCRVCLTDLSARPIAAEELPTQALPSGDAALAQLWQTALRLMRRTGADPARCVGIGTSAPGPLDHAGGRILQPTEFAQFCGLPVVERLRQRTGLSVCLENNAVALALLDRLRRGGEDGSVLFTVVADGIGSALLQAGRPFRGGRGFAGELGHLCVEPDGLRCTCGARGCLEQYATLRALRARHGFARYEEIVDRAEDGDRRAQAVLQDLTGHLGLALVDAVDLFDPEAVVLYGEYGYRATVLTARLAEYIAEHSLICRAHPVAVLPSPLTAADAGAAAAVSALDAFFARGGRL